LDDDHSFAGAIGKQERIVAEGLREGLRLGSRALVRAGRSRPPLNRSLTRLLLSSGPQGGVVPR
jgi:hypothetical protein